MLLCTHAARLRFVYGELFVVTVSPHSGTERYNHVKENIKEGKQQVKPLRIP
jgi:hypothetical protein